MIRRMADTTMAGPTTITLAPALYAAVRQAAAAMGVTPDEWVATTLRAQLTPAAGPAAAAAAAHREVASVAATLESDEAASPSLAPEVDTV
jgi:hypothetical protein